MMNWQFAIFAIILLVMVYKLMRHEESIRKNKKKIKKLEGYIFQVDNTTAEVFKALIDSHNNNTKAIEEMYPTYVEFEERAEALAKGLFDGETKE